MKSCRLRGRANRKADTKDYKLGIIKLAKQIIGIFGYSARCHRPQIAVWLIVGHSSYVCIYIESMGVTSNFLVF